MVRVNIDSDQMQATKETVVLLKLSFYAQNYIDELPQFFNVFINVSFVGPRPHM
jgi:lipopolysaccharide/colanic/teichoic acid biosynthesis glycosyltransferase